MGAAGVQHLAEELVQLIALRRRALRRQRFRADHIAVGADQADLRAGPGLQNVLDEISCRRLAVGAGDADHLHLPRRIAEEIARGDGQGVSAVLHEHIRHVAFRDALAQHGGGALLCSGGDETVAVADRADDGRKQIAGPGAAGVIADIADLGLGIGRHGAHRDILQKLF